MSKESPVRTAAAAAPPEDERCACGSEMTAVHDPFGDGGKACAPCRDRGLETQVSELVVRGIDVYGP